MSLSTALQRLTGNGTAFSERDARLALELVSGLSSVKDVLDRYGMTELELRQKLATPGFQALLKETRQAWQSDLNARERVKLKAALLVEDSLMSVFRVANDKDVGVTARLDAFKSLAKIASVDEADKQAGGGAGRFVLNINVPGVNAPVTIDGVASKAVDADDGFGEDE